MRKLNMCKSNMRKLNMRIVPVEYCVLTFLQTALYNFRHPCLSY